MVSWIIFPSAEKIHLKNLPHWSSCHTVPLSTSASIKFATVHLNPHQLTFKILINYWLCWINSDLLNLNKPLISSLLNEQLKRYFLLLSPMFLSLQDCSTVHTEQPARKSWNPIPVKKRPTVKSSSTKSYKSQLMSIKPYLLQITQVA